ncbi:MAG: hypothetical protein PHO07_13950, partial [Pirellulales bacterium]|nr:hypothetical protein [Pirellulales bacterium]
MSQKPSDPDLPAVQNAALETAEARSAGEPVDEFDAVLPKRSVLRNLIWATPSWLLSMILHVILLLAMAMLYLPAGAVDDVRDLLLASGEEEMLDELEDFEDEPLQTLDVVTSDALVLESVVEPTDIQMANFDEPAAAVQVDLSDFGLEQAPANDLLATVGAYSGDALSGRGAERERLVRRDGGNDASEQAVSLALDWFARHQMPDGGWSFDHTLCPNCRGQCRNPGSLAQ